ncbi:MAG TPA: hypothetical protein PKY97_07695, partial [Saprospiraceae bacterium]|nr:hypothetical protein [Saprospiraceae bacterium]
MDQPDSKIEFYEIKVAPKDVDNIAVHKQLFKANYGHLNLNFEDLVLTKRSIDARKGKVVYALRWQKMSEMVEDNGFKTLEPLPVEDVKKVVVVGAGPAGYFAAFQL